MTNLAQRSFGGGEIAPGLYARTDLSKYQTGLRTCRNFIVQKHGGVSNRPGTDFILPTKAQGEVRLLKFVFNDEQTYVLEFGHNYVRFFHRGAYVPATGDAWVTATEYEVGDIVLDDGVYFYCRKAHTSGALDEPGNGGGWPTVWAYMTGDVLELPTPYTVDELDELQYVQSGDLLTLVHPDHPPYDLIRAEDRWTIEKISFGPTLSGPTGLDVGGSGDAGTVFYAVTAVMEDTLEESLPSIFQHDKIASSTNPNSLVWDGIPGAISYNVYRSFDGVTYGLINAAGGLPSDINDATWADDTSTATSINNTDWTQAPDYLENVLTMNIATRAYDNTYNYSLLGTLTPTVGASGVSRGRFLIMVQPTGGLFGVGGALPVLAGISEEFTTVDGFENGPFEINGSFTLPYPFSASYTGLKVRFIPQAKGATVAGMVDFVLSAATPPNNVISWLKQTMAYGDYGFDADNAVAPPSDPGLFKAHGDFPRTAAFYQQRRFFASTDNEPLKVWGSQIGRFNNFARSTPLVDSDAVSFTMVGPQANTPRHMIDLGKLLIMTMGGEMRIDGDDSGIIRPDAINPNSAGENGIRANIRPLKVVDSMVYVQARGNIVRTLRPVAASGQHGNYEGTELSVMASHLFKGKTIVDWDYAKAPNSVVWVVRSDGVLLGLTYLPEHGLWGWHRHDTDGIVERVICVPEDDEDRVYLVVRRTIDGSTVRYIERMAQRSFDSILDAHFVDSAVKYDGRNITATTVTVSGMTAPEEEEGWGYEDLMTIVFSENYATADMVGKGIFVLDDNDEWLRITITQYNSPTELKGLPDRTVPSELRAEATTFWALATNTLDDLDHLEGKAVSILGDGYVVANPNRTDLEEVVVTDGAVEWTDLHVIVRVGLPFISDIQTLDIDSPSGPSVKEKKMLVDRVGLYVEESRGIFAGRANTVTDDDPLEGLQEYKARDDEEWGDPNALITDFIEIGFESDWSKDGRVFVRQVDPLPLSILSVTPMGSI